VTDTNGSATPDTQQCPRCKKHLDPATFGGASGRRHRSCLPCRELAREVNRRHRDKIGPAGVRAANLRVKYGISVEEYEALRVRQDFRCAICKRHEDEIPASMSGRPRSDGLPSAESFTLGVDHCHDSRRVRGLLCVGCNAAIGHFRDNEQALLGALAYLGFRPPTPIRQ
jgi:transposase-like protein